MELGSAISSTTSEDGVSGLSGTLTLYALRDAAQEGTAGRRWLRSLSHSGFVALSLSLWPCGLTTRGRAGRANPLSEGRRLCPVRAASPKLRSLCPCGLMTRRSLEKQIESSQRKPGSFGQSEAPLPVKLVNTLIFVAERAETGRAFGLGHRRCVRAQRAAEERLPL